MASISLAAGVDQEADQAAHQEAMELDWEMAAPGIEWRYPLVQARRGIVLRSGPRTLLADAAQWSKNSRQLYATGRIRLLIGDMSAAGVVDKNATRVHLAADRIGLDQTLSLGEAWEVHCTLLTTFGNLRLQAAHIAMTPEKWVFSDVKVDQGLGAVAEFSCERVELHLRDETAEDRSGIERTLSGVTFHDAVMRAAGIPIMYFPWAHRDYTIDYPWTRYRTGVNSRNGWYLRSEIGTDLPEVAGFHSTVRGRYDLNSRNGEAVGVSGVVHHRPSGGRGDAIWYYMPEEQVRNTGNGPIIDERSSTFVQAEYQQPLAGLGAVTGFWATVPDGVDGGAPDGRFRADFNDTWLENHPFARRGIQTALAFPFVSLTATTQANPNKHSEETEIPGRVTMAVPHVSLLGPVYAFGDVFLDQVQRDEDDLAQEATRLGGQFGGGIGGWLPMGLGLDLRSGVSLRSHHKGEINGVATNTPSQNVPFVSAQSRLRFVHESETLTGRVLPQVGFTWLGSEDVDDIAFDFNDGFDELAADRQFISTAVNGSLDWRNKPQLFTGRIAAQWGIRDQDRRYTDDDDVEQIGPSPLISVRLEASGQITSRFRLSGTGVYDGRRREWRNYDFSAGIVLIPNHWSITSKTTWLTDDTEDGQWQFQPGTIITGDRYGFQGEVWWNANDNTPERVELALTRRMVDGRLAVTYDLQRDGSGNLNGQTIGLDFVLRALPGF
jgi:hypothetical protein